MERTHDNKEMSTRSEALQAIKSGLTPAKVQLAILSGNRAATANECGFERNAITRLALRWGILESSGR